MTRPIVKIMIVDDHDSIRRGVRSLIESKPYFQVVGEAEDGFEAVEVAVATKPDVAVLDYCLPQRNGLALSQTLKQLMPQIEVVLFTMHAYRRNHWPHHRHVNMAGDPDWEGKQTDEWQFPKRPIALAKLMLEDLAGIGFVKFVVKASTTNVNS